jgi:hypothetical protein
MLKFGLDTGFIPTGVDLSPEGELSIRFRKDLTQPDLPPRESAPAPISDKDRRVQIPHTDVTTIRQYLDLNFDIVGMLHDPTTKVVLERTS